MIFKNISKAVDDTTMMFSQKVESVTNDLSDKITDVTWNASLTMQDAFNEACYFAQEQIANGAQAMSLWGNLLNQLQSPEDSDEVTKKETDRLERFGDPAAKIDFSKQKEYVPKKFRKYI